MIKQLKFYIYKKEISLFQILNYNNTLLNSGLVYDNSGWYVKDKERTIGNDYDTNQLNMEKSKYDNIFKKSIFNIQRNLKENKKN